MRRSDKIEMIDLARERVKYYTDYAEKVSATSITSQASHLKEAATWATIGTFWLIDLGEI